MKAIYIPQNVKTVILTALNMLYGSHCESWVGIKIQDQWDITLYGRTKIPVLFMPIMELCQGQKNTDAFLKSMCFPDLPTQLLEYSYTANNRHWLNTTRRVVPPLFNSVSLSCKENWNFVKKRVIRMGMATNASHFCTRKAYIKHAPLPKYLNKLLCPN